MEADRPLLGWRNCSHPGEVQSTRGQAGTMSWALEGQRFFFSSGLNVCVGVTLLFSSSLSSAPVTVCEGVFMCVWCVCVYTVPVRTWLLIVVWYATLSPCPLMMLWQTAALPFFRACMLSIKQHNIREIYPSKSDFAANWQGPTVWLYWERERERESVREREREWEREREEEGERGEGRGQIFIVMLM